MALKQDVRKKSVRNVHRYLMRNDICQQLKPEKKSEQQAFAGKGLDYVTDVYLPERLGKMGMV